MQSKRRLSKRPDPNAKPPAGIEAAHQAALDNKLTAKQIGKLLADYRAGNEGAKEKLRTGLEWIVYDFAANGRRRWWERLGPFYVGLETAIRRLRNNKESNVEQFVRDELCRCVSDYRREESPHILMPSSTKSKWGVDCSLRRDHSVEVVSDASRFQQGGAQHGLRGHAPVDSSHCCYDPDSASPMDDVACEVGMHDVISYRAATMFEMSVLRWLRAGYAPHEIALQTLVPYDRIQLAMNKMCSQGSWGIRTTVAPVASCGPYSHGRNARATPRGAQRPSARQPARRQRPAATSRAW
jgi:hypothetical protein